MDDVEQLVRGALRDRAAEITPATLHNHDLRPARRRSRAMPVMLATACFVAVAITVPVTLFVLRGGNPDDVAGSSPTGPYSGPPGYAGYRWLLTSVQANGQRFPVPPDIPASASFFPDGTVVFQDNVNALSGRYDAGADGFSVHDVGTTFVLYAGDDPVQKMVISAVGALASGQAVQANLSGTHLVLATPDYTMSFQRSVAIETGTAGPSPSR
jgi:heat shock protein HslJ